MAITNTDTKVITGKCRTSFVHIFEPSAIDEKSEKKYSMRLIIKKSDKETVEAIKRAQKNAAEAGKAKLAGRGGKLPSDLKLALRDADEEGLSEEFPELEGCYFVNATSKNKPGIIGRRKEPITDESKIYSGCFVRASLNFYAFNTNGNKGIACGLNNVQFWDDGDYLGGRASADSDFDELDDLPMDDDDDMFK